MTENDFPNKIFVLSSHNVLMLILEIFKIRYRRLSLKEAIIVAGLGRCGTTIVYDSLRDYGFIPGFHFTKFEDDTIFLDRHVYKTHSLPPKYLPNNVKLIFMFGNPFDIVISAHNKINEWGRIHHKNFGSDLFKENDILFHEDTLQLHKHFDLWYRQQSFPFISIKYEAFFKQETLITLNEFLGFKLTTLPPYRKRSSCWSNHPQKERLLEIYGDLFNKIESSQDITIWDAIPAKSTI